MTCQRLRGTDVFCEACRALVPEGQPLNVWLLAASVNLFIAPVNFLSALGRSWTGLREQSLGLLDGELAPWLGWSLLDAVLCGLVALVAVVALPRYLGRRRSAVRWVKVFFFVSVVSGVLTRWALGRAHLAVPALIDWSLLSSPFWLVFFERSSVVPKTFVR